MQTEYNMREFYVALETITGNPFFVGESQLDVEKQIDRDKSKYDMPGAPEDYYPYEFNIIGPLVLKEEVEKRDEAIRKFIEVQEELLYAHLEEGEAVRDVKVPAHWKDAYDGLKALVK
jgi:hypothetical protein